jgi:hypothetical protein
VLGDVVGFKNPARPAGAKFLWYQHLHWHWHAPSDVGRYNFFLRFLSFFLRVFEKRGPPSACAVWPRSSIDALVILSKNTTNYTNYMTSARGVPGTFTKNRRPPWWVGGGQRPKKDQTLRQVRVERAKLHTRQGGARAMRAVHQRPARRPTRGCEGASRRHPR